MSWPGFEDHGKLCSPIQQDEGMNHQVGWKLIDSDSALHDLEVMQNVEKKDEGSMAKAEKELVHQSPDCV